MKKLCRRDTAFKKTGVISQPLVKKLSTYCKSKKILEDLKLRNFVPLPVIVLKLILSSYLDM
jgi:hypothetical protein